MRKLALTVVAVSLGAFGRPATADEKPGTAMEIIVIAAKPGMAVKLEEGRKKHADWHRRQNDTWAWEVWQVLTGPDSGNYVAGTFGHHWKDFDAWQEKLGKADAADFDLNVAPFVASTTTSYWNNLPEVSRPPEAGTPVPMIQITVWQVKPGSEGAFMGAIKKIHEAIVKTNWPAHYYIQELVDGGEQPTYVLVTPMKGLADLEPLEPPFPAMLEKAYGRSDADAVMKAFNDSIVSQRSHIEQHRPDLSYRPAK